MPNYSLEFEGEKDLVSVVIPYYKLGDTIDETIQSIKQSDYKKIEIVVVDDGDGVVRAQINGSGENLMVQADNPAYNADYKAAQDAYISAHPRDGSYDDDPDYPHREYNHDTPEKLDTGIFALTVNNPKSQFELPTTGGMGILLFTLGGAVVLAAAIVIFTLARKKKDRK